MKIVSLDRTITLFYFFPFSVDFQQEVTLKYNHLHMN